MNCISKLCIALAAAACCQNTVYGDIRKNATGDGRDTVLYHEPYRPAYHYTPKHRWIGDPCGLVRHDGRYLAYCWGAAESDDLIHWRELNNDAITGMPDNIAAFTGSVVVDKNNTAQWGDSTLVAVFTSFDKDSKKQSQSVAFSHDSGATYRYYDLNPVLDIWSTEFRDPTVIRYEPSGKWVMAVAKALEKKVAFYESDDLKSWTWTSDFGPMGDNERSWECPDLFQLTVEETGEKKWVLVVSVNWAREQYFVGDFDGKKFIPDNPYGEPMYVDNGLDYYASRVFQDYDGIGNDVVTIGWVNTWDYAQQAPSEWGKGVWSIPRSLTLYRDGDLLRMRQQPVGALRQLRGKEYGTERTLKAGVTALPALSAMGNQYEMDVRLDCSRDDTAGLNLCCGDGRTVRVAYDAASGYLKIDRTNVAGATLPKFDRMAYAKAGHDGKVDLRIFVDKSTIEIFADGGKKVFTLLTYAVPRQDGVEAWSMRGGTKMSIKAWPLAGIHD